MIWLWLDGRVPPDFDTGVWTFFAGAMLSVFYFNHLYSFKTWLFWDEIKAVVTSSFIVLMIIILYMYSQSFSISRFMICVGIIVFVPLCLISRYAIRIIFFKLGLLSKNIIILGAGRTGSIFAEKIAENPFTLGKVICFLDDDPKKIGTSVSGIEVRGKLELFPKIYEQEKIDEAVIAISTASRKLLTNILDLVEFRVTQVHYIPDTYMLATFSPAIRDVGGMPLASASQGLMNPVNQTIKSVVDFIASVIALVLMSPFMLWIALKIKRSDGGKIFSTRERAGLNGKTFMMYKFRSSGLKGAGASLRRSYFDELPQLFNVLKGEMSLVGPKALIPSYLDRAYGHENAKKICRVKPGMTGFWQIADRTGNNKKIRAETNLYYIRNWSLWLDLIIFFRTFFTLFLKKDFTPPQSEIKNPSGQKDQRETFLKSYSAIM
ncbi:MAG: sugar transferase [Synergistaceae bacterium]|nr:sugar transferase [Synergistaceae bacterium]